MSKFLYKYKIGHVIIIMQKKFLVNMFFNEEDEP